MQRCASLNVQVSTETGETMNQLCHTALRSFVCRLFGLATVLKQTKVPAPLYDRAGRQNNIKEKTMSSPGTPVPGESSPIHGAGITVLPYPHLHLHH